jgi:hypothetical protein
MTEPVARPRLSVVIPAYNVAPFVAEAIVSALTQTVAELDVVVVDDGSTDGTAAVVAAIADPRLRLVQKPNGGLSSARNAGIRAARAPFVGFLDADNRWRPDKAARHLEVMESAPTIAVTFSDSAYIDERGRPTGQLLAARLAEPGLLEAVRYNWLGNGSTPVVRRAVFATVGGFDESLRAAEDQDLWVRILHRGAGRIVRVPAVLTEYRIRDGSLSMVPEVFIQGGEALYAKFRRDLPGVPGSVLDRGRAGLYRVASRKCPAGGRVDEAWRWLVQAVRLSPGLFLTDRKAIATLILVALSRALPASRRTSPYAWLDRALRWQSRLRSGWFRRPSRVSR